jgi:hypothetical protein
MAAFTTPQSSFATTPPVIVGYARKVFASFEFPQQIF